MAQGSGVAVCQGTVGKHPLPRYGAVAHGNRLVRTRMPGGVGRGREKLPLTRFAELIYFEKYFTPSISRKSESWVQIVHL